MLIRFGIRAYYPCSDVIRRLGPQDGQSGIIRINGKNIVARFLLNPDVSLLLQNNFLSRKKLTAEMFNFSCKKTHILNKTLRGAPENIDFVDTSTYFEKIQKTPTLVSYLNLSPCYQSSNRIRIKDVEISIL